jgi:hypothetical protein
MELSGYRHVLIAITKGKGPPVPIGWEAGCDPDTVVVRIQTSARDQSLIEIYLLIG